MRILHLSDPHFGQFEWASHFFTSKRIIGMANYLWRRRKIYHTAPADALAAFIEKKHIEYIVVSGDFCTTALEAEMARGKAFLEGVSKYVKNVFVVPGNHDAYIPDVVQRKLFDRYFSDFYGESMTGESAFPWTQMLEQDILLVGLNSAQPMPLYSAQGLITKDAIGQLDRFLKKSKAKFKIVLNHYPLTLPADQPVGFCRDLINGPALLSVLSKHKVNLYLHGHVDRQWFVAAAQNYPLIVNSGSLTHRGRECFMIYDILSAKKIICEVYGFQEVTGWTRGETKSITW